ncbi:MAG: hypothetical protein ACPKM0_04235 [Pleomorphochaeta sp.]
MDIRRVRIKDDENATVLSNDLIRAVVQDYNGRLIELSAMNIHGGWVNCNKLHRFPFSKDTVDQNIKHKDIDPLLEKLYGYQVQLVNDESKENPNAKFEGSDLVFNNIHNYEDLLIKSETLNRDENNDYINAIFETNRVKWVVQRYGSDEATGGVWVLSKNSDNNNKIWATKRLDVVLPNQPVIYSALYIKNISSSPINLNVGFDNTLAPPFLESNCLINTGAKQWMKYSDLDKNMIIERIADTKKPFPIEKAPLISGGNCDVRTVSGIIGSTDVLYAKNDLDKSSHIWFSVINPRYQLVYLTFAPGKEIMDDIDLNLDYSTMVLDYGGRNQPPWSLYQGGPSNEFSIHMGANTSYYGQGKGVEFKPGEEKRLLYARSLTTYDNQRMGNNFSSFESFNHNVVLKRTKSTIVIPSDPKFEIIKKFCDNLIHF